MHRRLWGSFGELTQNVDFKCNTAICFGVGPVHDQFKTLQQTINRFSSLGAGFVPLDVDGFIGDLTVAAANAAAKIAALPSPGLTHEAVAVNALTFTAQLQDVLNTFVTVGVVAPIDDAERALAAGAAEDTIPTTPPSALISDIIATSTPSPEIDGGVQQIVVACRQSRSSPVCTRAKNMCKALRGTPQASLGEISEICDATTTPIGLFLLAGGIAIAAIVGIVWIRRRRSRAGEQFSDSDDWEDRRIRRPQRRRALQGPARSLARSALW